MCGRYLLLTGGQSGELREILAKAADRAGRMDSGEICPTMQVPVLREEAGQLAAVPMVWGWPRPPKAGSAGCNTGVVINTRGETAAEKSLWREAYRCRRAIVPTSGFIEWRRADGPGAPGYLLRLPGTEALYLAAVWGRFVVNGRPEDRFSIMTTQANAWVEPLHDRMPVVLLRDEFDQWLHGDYQKLVDRSALRLERSLYGSDVEQTSLF